MTTAPHPSRSAPKCVDCAHLSPKQRNEWICNHPFMPVDMIEGKSEVPCSIARVPERTPGLPYPNTPGLGQCGTSGKLFAPATQRTEAPIRWEDAPEHRQLREEALHLNDPIPRQPLQPGAVGAPVGGTGGGHASIAVQIYALGAGVTPAGAAP